MTTQNPDPNLDPIEVIKKFLVQIEREQRRWRSGSVDYYELATQLHRDIKPSLLSVLPKDWPKPTMKKFLAILKDILNIQWNGKASLVSVFRTHLNSRKQLNELGEVDHYTALEVAFVEEMNRTISVLDSVADNFARDRHRPTKGQCDQHTGCELTKNEYRYIRARRVKTRRYRLQDARACRKIIESDTYDGQPLMTYEQAIAKNTKWNKCRTHGGYGLSEEVRTAAQRELGMGKGIGKSFKATLDEIKSKVNHPELAAAHQRMKLIKAGPTLVKIKKFT